MLTNVEEIGPRSLVRAHWKVPVIVCRVDFRRELLLLLLLPQQHLLADLRDSLLATRTVHPLPMLLEETDICETSDEYANHIPHPPYASLSTPR